MNKLFKVTATIFMILSATSCQKVAGNQLTFFLCSYNFIDNKIEVIRPYGTRIVVDYNNSTYYYNDKYDINTLELQNKVVVNGGTAPNYSIKIQDGYENIEKHLLNYDMKDSENSVIYTEGYLIDYYVYGICNVYSGPVGYLSGSGIYDEEEIAYSIYYKYDNYLDEMTTIYKVDSKMIVAFSDNKIIYWKDKALYSYDILLDNETYLCDDLSYCSGNSHQSTGTIYFNKEFALLNFIEGNGTDNMYIYHFNNDSGIKLELIENV